MEQLFQDLLQRFETIHKTIETTIVDLPAEAFDWNPGPDMNSIAVLLVHTAGSLRYWAGDVAGDLPSGRVRAEEFEAFDVPAVEMLGRLNAAFDTTRQVLGRLDLSSLAEARTVGTLNEERTVGWALLHALEHTALHTGHIQMTRQLWDQRGQS